MVNQVSAISENTQPVKADNGVKDAVRKLAKELEGKQPIERATRKSVYAPAIAQGKVIA